SCTSWPTPTTRTSSATTTPAPDGHEITLPIPDRRRCPGRHGVAVGRVGGAAGRRTRTQPEAARKGADRSRPLRPAGARPANVQPVAGGPAGPTAPPRPRRARRTIGRSGPPPPRRRALRPLAAAAQTGRPRPRRFRTGQGRAAAAGQGHPPPAVVGPAAAGHARARS